MRIVGAIAAVIIACAGCSDPLAPRQYVRPALSGLSFDDLETRLTPLGLLYIRAVPADDQFRLAAHARVPVTITTSGGDVETVGLFRELCPARERGGASWLCFEFIVSMQDGWNPTSIEERVLATGGRLTAIGTHTAGVVLFSPTDVPRKAREMESWPGVAFTEMNGFFWSGAPPPNLASFLALPVPVDSGVARVRDGVVEVRSGDTVTVVYVQPDDTQLAFTVSVP